VCIAGLTWWLYTALPDQKPAVRRRVVYPFAFIAVVFAGLYFGKIIPPVPLSLSEIGVYHQVVREGGRFKLSMTRSRWKFWQHGDQSFLARPGDAVYCWVVVFAPVNFRERLQVRWFSEGPEGWIKHDTIPLPIAGGRDDGWRGFTAKANYTPGNWRVAIITSDNRELGRIDLTISDDPSAAAQPQGALALSPKEA